MATTKTKKAVSTPIDERETFVSLQKNFADNEQDVQEKLNTLYQLQIADNEIDKLVQLRGELPAEVDTLKAEVDGLKAKLAHLSEVIDGYNQKIALENDRKVEIDSETDKYQKQLENIANSREYDSLNKELENLGLERQIADKTIAEAKAAIEGCKEDISNLEGRVAIREEDLKAKEDELATIVESTAKEEAELVARREACAAKIDERTMSAYTRIRASENNHLAVVGVYQGNACGGCFTTITPQRLVDIASGKKLVICEHCGRIIVNAEQ